MPILYLGTLFGVKVGTMLSEVVLAVSLASVLLFVAVNTAIKAKELFNKENVQRQKAKEALNPSSSLQGKDEKKPLQFHLEIEAANSPLSEAQKLVSEEMKTIYKNESEHFALGRTLNFVSTLSLLFITSMMMGSKYQR